MAKKKVTKAKKKKFAKFILTIIVIVVLLIAGYFVKDEITANDSSESTKLEESSSNIDLSDKIVDNITFDNLQIHFLELGNASTGDSTYIKAGNTDILIDAGSTQASAETIISYVNQYCNDGKLEYVITTHAHADHYYGMFGKSKTNDNKSPKNYKGQSVEKTGIYYYYDIDTIIDFALTNQEGKQYYGYYQDALSYAINNGTTHYNAADCFNNKNGAKNKFILDETNNITLDILYNKYYFEKSDDENNYSVCTMINYNDQHFLFTGDLEKGGEEALVAYYDKTTPEKTLPKVELFKAGHHGSDTSSNTCLLELIKPEICCVCCCAGTTEYTFDRLKSFPSQAFIDRIATYTDRVYVTSVIDEKKSRENEKLTYGSLNGNIIISCNGTNIGVNATNNTIKLKDSEWFNGLCYIDSTGRLYPKNGKSSNYYNETDSNVTATTRRIWPNK